MSQIILEKKQVESLIGFVFEIIRDFPELGNLDGFDIQDLGERYNILIPQTRYKPCAVDCDCREYYSTEEWQKGVTCYRLATWLTRAAQLCVQTEREQVPIKLESASDEQNTD